jgi:pSer/pThr/pTyr-binding forkhead associated (FHA) protein
MDEIETDEIETPTAWLEQSSGERVPLVGTCSIGRMSTNSIALVDDRVSRRHAIINVQDESEYWLVDLGSNNGTNLNGRRVVQPIRLRAGDCIEIGPFKLIFQQNLAPVTSETTFTSFGGRTLEHIASHDCWLMVVDIKGSTHLMRTLSATELPRITGRWLDDCKRLIEKNCGGSVNKYLGDGFFAYWRHDVDAGAKVAKALEEFARMKTTAQLEFRVILHFGQVLTGGAASLGEESLQGQEVHFTFRMEKVAGSLGHDFMVSQAAKEKLGSRLTFVNAGAHPLGGFDGDHPFYSLPLDQWVSPRP